MVSDYCSIFLEKKSGGGGGENVPMCVKCIYRNLVGDSLISANYYLGASF